MSSPELDLDRLSDSERTALETYMAVTSQEPSEAIPLLQRSEWNVQVGTPYRGLWARRALDLVH